MEYNKVISIENNAQKLTVAAIQMELLNGMIEENLGKAAGLVDEAANKGSQFYHLNDEIILERFYNNQYCIPACPVGKVYS